MNISFEYWFDKMVDKLESEYSEYLEEIDSSIKRVISFNEFAHNKFESMLDDRDNEEYERFRDENR